MALKKRLTLETGVILPEAYLKVERILGNKDEINATLCVYFNQAACNDLKPAVHSYSFFFTPSEENDALRWDKQAYEHIKSLPEFTDAIDVLE